MAIGDYLSNMFLGNSGEPSDASKKGTEELWKIYQQAYNVNPVWDGKKWTIPPGAVQRFQMLLPILQAQITAGRSTGQQGNDKGLLAGILSEGGKGLLGGIGKKVGGWEGIMDKVGGSVKGWFDSPSTGGEVQTPYDSFTPEGPTFDTSIPTFDSLPVDEGFNGLDPDWENFIPTDTYADMFTPAEYASAGDWW